MTSFTLITPPAAEPVTLAEAKLHARIDTAADDALITTLITTARQWAETYTRRAFINQSWQMALDTPPMKNEAWWDGMREGAIMPAGTLNYIDMPRPPLVSISSVQVFDDSDTPTVWNANNYFVDTVRQPGRLVLRNGASWPLPTRTANGIIITYIAGYGANASAVPEQLKTAIKQLVAHWYEHRGEAPATGSTRHPPAFNAVNVPMVIQALLDGYRVRASF